MEKKVSESTSQRPEGNRILNANLVTLDLPHFMRMIREEKKWNEGVRNAITIFKSNDVRVVMIALHAGGDLPEHTAKGTITVQILEGKMDFSTAENSVQLAAGQMLVLQKNIPHSVMAIEETVFLLTVAV